MVTGGVGAIGPFSPAEVTAFETPTLSKDTTMNAQFKEFDRAHPGVTSKYVAFRQQTPDRFLSHAMFGLRLYTFYAESKATARPLSRAPAFVEVQWGMNQLLSERWKAWHAAAYYPFAFGDRADPRTILLYFFGDVWMIPGKANNVTSLYELKPAVENDKPVPLTDARVTILGVPPERTNARDTYRVGVSLDLMRVWERLTQPAEKK
jgi:hypothetical protein